MTPAEDEDSRAEELRLIRETLQIMTGGCEICQYSSGPFCKKHGRPVAAGDTRCPDFARRSTEQAQKASRAYTREFVYGRLGIKGKNLDRLAGKD